MIRPSYMELIKEVNEVNKELGENEILSRYSLVQACAKRARQLIDNDPAMVKTAPGTKELSIAVEEARQGKLGITVEDIVPIEPIQLEYDTMAVVDLNADEEEEED